MDEDPEALWGVAEASGSLSGGDPLDEEGTQGLVLAMGGMGRLEEAMGEIR
jgi:hypothetical protein